MLQIGGDLDLVEKPLSPNDRGQLRPQHLERHLAVVLHIMGLEHDGHAPLAQLTLDAIAVGDGGREAFGDFGHGR